MTNKDTNHRASFGLTRRQVTQALAASAAVAAFGLPATTARAESTVNFLGWQGYDDPIAFDDFLKSRA